MNESITHLKVPVGDDEKTRCLGPEGSGRLCHAMFNYYFRQMDAADFIQVICGACDASLAIHEEYAGDIA